VALAGAETAEAEGLAGFLDPWQGANLLGLVGGVLDRGVQGRHNGALYGEEAEGGISDEAGKKERCRLLVRDHSSRMIRRENRGDSKNREYTHQVFGSSSPLNCGGSSFFSQLTLFHNAVQLNREWIWCTWAPVLSSLSKF
jgi:hypothetical protein